MNTSKDLTGFFAILVLHIVIHTEKYFLWIITVNTGLN